MTSEFSWLNDDRSDQPDQKRRRLVLGGCAAAAGALFSGVAASEALAEVAPDVVDYVAPPGWDFFKSVTLNVKAPASVVWEVLMDLPNYHLWNVSCRRAESTLKIGDPIRLWWAPGGLGEPHVALQYIAVAQPPTETRWGRKALISKPSQDAPWSAKTARGDRYIEPLGPDRCRYSESDSWIHRTGPEGEEMMAVTKIAFDLRVLGVKWRSEQVYASRKKG